MMDTDFDTASLFARSCAVRTPTIQRTLFVRQTLVDTSSLNGTRYTIAQIVSECLYAGQACTEPQALAAAFSVPDGTPLAMACLNVGPMPDDAVCALVGKWQANERALRRRFG